MNPSVLFVCLILAFVAYIEAVPMRGNWASGAIKDRDPSNPNIHKLGSKATASADGKNPQVWTSLNQNGESSQSAASASSQGGNISTFASASG